MEIWEKIEGFEYLISSEGRVKKSNGKLMSPWKLRQGYLQVGLSRNSKRHKFLVHRLVADAFIDKIEDKNIVNHKNLDKADNRVCNLEWVTSTENADHFIKTFGIIDRNIYQQEFKMEVANFDGGMLESKRFYDLPTSTVLRWRKEFRII